MLRKKPAQDALYVSIQGGHRLVEGQAGHGSCGVRPEPREAKKFFLRLGYFPAQLPANDFCGIVEVPRPGIVTQACPSLENLLPGGIRQVLERGESFQEALIIRDDRLHPGLLEHELGDQNPVRSGTLPPGEGSFVGFIPPEKCPLKSGLLRQGVGR